MINQELTNLIDEMVGANASKPLYNPLLTNNEKVCVFILNDFKSMGVSQMHYTQLMKHVGVNKITIYKVIKNLMKHGVIVKGDSGYYKTV